MKLKYDGIGIQCSFKDSYIWGQNREEHLLATSDHFELTVSDFSIVKTTVVLWKQGKNFTVKLYIIFWWFGYLEHVTLRCQINETTRLTFFEFFPDLLSHLFGPTDSFSFSTGMLESG